MEDTHKKIKICLVVTKGVWGGAQKYVYNLATELPREKYDVLVVTGKGEVLKQKLQEKNVRVISIESLKRNISVISEIISFFKLFSIIWREKPDILHLNSPKAGGLGSLIGRILRVKKIIFTAHGWTFNEDRPLLQNALILLLSWVTIFLCHKIIVIAPREEEQAKLLPLVNPRKIILIRNGIEEVKFISKTSARKELLEKSMALVSNKTLWIGTIAELHKNKGLEYAIEALKKIKSPFKYFIIGEGEERDNLENLLEKNDLKEKVHLLGHVDKASHYLKAFDMFLLTSTKEGLPYTVLEAGLAELPVIASSIGGIPDIIDNGKNGILTTKARSGEIYRAIEYMIENPEKRKIFGENLKLKVEKNFSLKQMLEKTEKLYTE